MKDKIIQYIKALHPSIFNQDALKNVKITKITATDYNIVYSVTIDGKKYVLKTNVHNPFQNNSPLTVEHQTLKYLNNVFGPKVYHLDTTRKDLPHDIIIYEHIEGTTPKAYEKQVLVQIAKVMSIIHSIDTDQMKHFLPTRTPFDNFELFTAFPKEIKKSKELNIIHNLIAKGKHELFNNKSMFTNVNQCFIHYALHLENIVFEKEKIKLLDWNLSCKGDKAEDIAMVFSLANIYYRKPFDQRMRNLFLEQFTLYGDDRTLNKRLKLFEFLTSLYVVCVLYKLLFSSETPKEILKYNKKKYETSLKYGIEYLKKTYK